MPFHTFKSIYVCEQVNKLTLFVRCFEQCSFAETILAHGFICLTCESILVWSANFFTETKQALSPILW